ncbi:unnamed protein product [Effrenium voratum]|nr:unnamed protein product [Effrenium voratum]
MSLWGVWPFVLVICGVHGLEFEVDASAMVQISRGNSGLVRVAYSADAKMIEGLKASISSCVEASRDPSKLMIHVMVLKENLSRFQRDLGVDGYEKVTKRGARIKLHEIPEWIAEKETGNFSESTREIRGDLDKPENYARIHMDKILQLRAGIVVWLDADTIVQRDVKEMSDQLAASGKTIGFVDRSTLMWSEYVTGFCCDRLGISLKELMNLHAYNVGVCAINLERWRESKAADRFQELVREHNSCPGGIWQGGSQPPLTLTFQLHPKDSPEDFILFDSRWNTGQLGVPGREFTSEELAQSFVLHWSGSSKPWMWGGHHKKLWLPHLQKFAEQ